jgi:hypothetical protein
LNHRERKAEEEIEPQRHRDTEKTKKRERTTRKKRRAASPALSLLLVSSVFSVSLCLCGSNAAFCLSVSVVQIMKPSPPIPSLFSAKAPEKVVQPIDKRLSTVLL